MSKGNRKESKVEFDNNYFKIYADYMRLKSNNFGVKNEMLEKHSDDIRNDELFPVREVYHRQTREELIKQTFYENKEELKCLKKTILSY